MKKFQHSVFDVRRILLGMEYDLLADAEVERHPTRAADVRRNQPAETSPFGELAYSVIERAFRDIKRGSKSAREFFVERDYEGYRVLAGIDPDAMERIREAALDPSVELPETMRGRYRTPAEPRESGGPTKLSQHKEVIDLYETGMRRKEIASELGLRIRQVDYAIDVIRKQVVA